MGLSRSLKVIATDTDRSATYLCCIVGLTMGLSRSVSEIESDNNNNTNICKAYIVSIRAESEAPIFIANFPTPGVFNTLH